MNQTRPETSAARPTLWPGLSPFLLILVSVAAILRIFEVSPLVVWLELFGLLGFFALEFSRLTKMARLLIGLSVALVVFEYVTARFDPALMSTAIGRAAFMAFFLNSLSFLQHAASRSPLLLNSGRILVHQPPGRRYIVLTFGAALFGMLLNLSTIGLLGTMIRKGVDPGEDDEARRIADIRRKRMSLAMLRGFCSIPTWSPITVTIALVTAAMPGLSWAQTAVYSAPLGVAYLLLGWVLDRRAYPRRAAVPHPQAPSLKGLLPLLILAVSVPTVAYFLSLWLKTSMIVALLLALPVISSGWLWLQERGTEGAPRRVAHEIMSQVVPALPNMRTEITLFSCSAFLGVLVANLIDTEALGAAITAIGLSSGATLAISAWLIVGLSMVGLSPIISVTILAGTLPKLTALAIEPVAVGVMLVSVWAISVNVAPYSTAVRLAARMVDRTPEELGPKWNGQYALLMLCLLSAILLAFG